MTTGTFDHSIQLHFTEYGAGTPVVLLHGYPLSGAIWADQGRALSDAFRVIAPDLRGHGQSPVPEGTYEMASMADDVLALLDTLGIEKAAIMGHSMGGYVALALWNRAPERFLALGLIASHAWADTEEARAARYATAQKVATEGSGVVAEAMLPKLFAPNPPADEAFVEQARQIILGTSPRGITGALRGMAARPDSTGLLPHINVPTLLLAGDSDQIVALARVEQMAAMLPNATLVTVENAGHMPMMEQPQATALAIRNFLAEQVLRRES